MARHDPHRRGPTVTIALTEWLMGLRDYALVVAALAGALTAMAAALRLRPVRYLVRYLLAEPARIMLTPMMHDAIATSPTVQVLHHELTRNDGSSIKDAVARIERRLEAGDRAIDGMREQLVTDGARLDAQQDTLRVIQDAVSRPAG